MQDKKPGTKVSHQLYTELNCGSTVSDKPKVRRCWDSGDKGGQIC